MAVVSCMTCRATARGEGDILTVPHQKWCKHHVDHDQDGWKRLKDGAMYCPGCHQIRVMSYWPGPRIMAIREHYQRTVIFEEAGIVTTFSHDIRNLDRVQGETAT